MFREAYLNAKYYSQAFEHLENALKMNTNMLTESETIKNHHSHILELLSQCYIEEGKTNEILEILERTLIMNKSILGDDDFSNSGIHNIIANVYLKKSMYVEAVSNVALMSGTVP